MTVRIVCLFITSEYTRIIYIIYNTISLLLSAFLMKFVASDFVLSFSAGRYLCIRVCDVRFGYDTVVKRKRMLYLLR